MNGQRNTAAGTPSGVSQDALVLLAALLSSAGALMVLGLAGPGAGPVVVGLLALLASGAVALGARRAIPDRLMPFGFAAGIAALLLVGIDARLVAPDATVAYAATALTLAALAISGRLGGSGLHASGVVLAAGAAQAAQAIFFLLGGEPPWDGPRREVPAVAALFIAAGSVLVVGELRHWKWRLAPAGAVVTFNHVALLTGAIELGSWVATLLYGLLAAFVVRALWRRVPLSVGSRIIGGFGAVTLFVLLLAWGLTFSLQRSLDLSAAARVSHDVHVQVAELSVDVERLERVHAGFVSSGEPDLYRRTLELGSDLSATGQRMRELTSGHALAAATDRLVRFLDDWVADLGEATTAGREEFLRTGLTEMPERFTEIDERVVDFANSELNVLSDQLRAAQQQARRLQASVLVGTAIVIALSAIFAIVLSRSIGRRTSRLKDAATSIASGRPDQEQLKLRDGGDDLDELARAFELMRQRLAALAAAEAQRSAELSSVLEAATELSIIGTDPLGIITSFSRGAERMLGWTAAEMIGEAIPSQRIHDPNELAAYAKRLGGGPEFETFVAAARTEPTVTQHWTYVRKDGSRLSVEVAVSARRDPQGELIGFLKIARDLTAQNNFEAALTAARVTAEEADRAKSTFLADMSHELRTPLNAILGFSELLTEQLASALNDRQKRFFSNIHVAGEHLLGLINDVLDLSKVESGRLEMRPEVIELEPLLEPAVVAARAEAEKAGLTFECAEHASGLVRLDAGRTRQVVFNLLSNAVKFTVAPGTVKLDVRFEGDALVMSVADSGIGIPPEDAPRVFGLFERVNRDRSDALGTGLGLALTKRLVELQGGTISFDSVVGRGTTFTVVLPDTRYHVIHSEAILIVEDEWADAELLAALASDVGLSTHRVSTLADALDAMRHARPLAVILDLFLPDGHGASILEMVKSSAETADVPVLVVTSATETARFQLMGAECMTKPIDPVRVRAWLRRVAPPVAA